jgi:osmotically-inducible protein OsmY
MESQSGQRVLLLAMILSVFMTTGCGKTIRPSVDDTSITTRVKTALLNDPEIKALSIDVATSNGVVTLSGQVRSAQERDKAVETARRTTGVADVKSALQISG